MQMTDEEALEQLDNLLECIRESRENGVEISLLDPLRTEMLRFSYYAVKRALRESGCKAKVTCKQIEVAPDVGAVSIEGKEVDIVGEEATKWFHRAMEFADNAEVYPLVNGKIRFTLGFNGMLLTE